MADAAVSETSSSVVENQSSFIGKEGKLLKKGKFLNSWHECTLKLEKDCIAYKKIDKKHKLKLIVLLDITVEQPEDNTKLFIIKYLNKKKKDKTFAAETEEDCQQWMEAIFEAKLDGKDRNASKSEACSIQ